MPITVGGRSLEKLVRSRAQVHAGAQWRPGRPNRRASWTPLTHGLRRYNHAQRNTAPAMEPRFYAYEAAERRAMYAARPSKWCQAILLEVFPPKERGPHPNPLGDGMLGAPFHQSWNALEAVESGPEVS